MDIKLKTLSYCGYFVDESMLTKGIYQTLTPALHPFEQTIQGVISEKISQMKDSGITYKDIQAFIENISKCELVDVELTRQ